MEESRRYIRLGLFVVLALAILFAVLFLLGGRKLFQPTFTFETYFNESVAGLDVGAPVRFRGVPLGQVSEILTSAAIYEKDVPFDKRREYIVVRARIGFSGQQVEHMKRDALQMVKKGLRAQTQLAGITGQQYLSIDFHDPAKYPPLEFPWTPKYTYLPSAPSLSGELVANAQAFLASLNKADIAALSHNLGVLVTDLDKKLNEVPVAELSAQTHDLLENANATVARVDRILAAAPIDQTLRKLDSASGRLDALLADQGDVDRMVKHIDEAAERLDALIGDNQYDVHAVVQDLHVTTDNLRVLSETIKRYPAGALVGGPPEKIKIPVNSP